MKKILQLFILVIIHSLTIAASEDSGCESDALPIAPAHAAHALPQPLVIQQPQPAIINQQPQLQAVNAFPVASDQEEEITYKKIFWDNPECCCILSCCCKAISSLIIFTDESNREAYMERFSQSTLIPYIDSSLTTQEIEEQYFKNIELSKQISTVSSFAIFYFTRKFIKKYSKEKDD